MSDLWFLENNGAADTGERVPAAVEGVLERENAF